MHWNKAKIKLVHQCSLKMKINQYLAQVPTSIVDCKHFYKVDQQVDKTSQLDCQGTGNGQ